MNRKNLQIFNENKSRLLPCPWCGPDEYHINGPMLGLYSSKQFPIHYSVSCTCCGAESNNYDEHKDAAIKTWNTRYSLDSKEEGKILINEAINALKKVLE